MNPRMYSAWMFLGFMNNKAGRHDSASFYLEVADGLNPYTPGILNELGRAYYFSNRQADALKLWERSLSVDSSQYVPVLAIARWHKSQGDDQEASRLLAVAASKPGAPGNVHLELARDHAENSRLTKARVALMQAIEDQADTLKVQAFVREYPMLAPPPADTTKAGAPEPDAVSDAT
jgi:Flp pilus assembly protein TadD